MYTIKADGQEFTVSSTTLEKTNLLTNNDARISKSGYTITLDVCPNKFKTFLNSIRDDDSFLETLKPTILRAPQTLTVMSPVPGPTILTMTGGGDDIVTELFNDQTGGTGFDSSILQNGNREQISAFFNNLQEQIKLNQGDPAFLNKISSDPNIMEYIKMTKQNAGAEIDSDIDSIGFNMSEIETIVAPNSVTDSVGTIGFRMTTEWNTDQDGGDPTDTISSLSSGSQLRSRYIDVLMNN